MVEARYPHVNTVRKRLAGGVVRLFYYYRPTGRRIAGAPGSAEFAASYALAVAEAREAPALREAGVLKGLITAYLKSPEFTGLRASTRLEYQRMLAEIAAEFGDMPLEALNDPAVRGVFLDWRDTIASEGKTRAADNRLSVLSAVLSFGVERGKIAENRLRGFKRLYHADRADKIWTPADVARFADVADAPMRLALFVALYTGQRQGDLLRLTWAAYRDDWIRLKQSKGGRAVAFKAVAQLRGLLDAKVAAGRVSTHILTTPTGRPWQKRNFSRAFKTTCDRAGIAGLTFHDLRGTAVTMLSEAGCDTTELCSITGHSLKSATGILERYRAITMGHGASAMAKLENYLRTDSANRLQTVAADGTNGGCK